MLKRQWAWYCSMEQGLQLACYLMMFQATLPLHAWMCTDQLVPFWASGKAELDNRGGLLHAQTLQQTPQLYLLDECTALFEVWTNDVTAHTHSQHPKCLFQTQSTRSNQLKAILFPQIILTTFNTESERSRINALSLRKPQKKGTVVVYQNILKSCVTLRRVFIYSATLVHSHLHLYFLQTPLKPISHKCTFQSLLGCSVESVP